MLESVLWQLGRLLFLRIPHLQRLELCGEPGFETRRALPEAFFCLLRLLRNVSAVNSEQTDLQFRTKQCGANWQVRDQSNLH